LPRISVPLTVCVPPDCETDAIALIAMVSSPLTEKLPELMESVPVPTMAAAVVVVPLRTRVPRPDLLSVPVVDSVEPMVTFFPPEMVTDPLLSASDPPVNV